MDSPTRKRTWKDRLTKRFGVSPTRQYPSETSSREGGKTFKEREGDRKRSSGDVRNGPGAVETGVDVYEEWCVLDSNGSDLSFDTPAVFVGGSTEEFDGVVYHADSGELGMEHTDGFLDRFRGSKKGQEKVDGGKNGPTLLPNASPPASSGGGGGVGQRKSSFGSRLRPDGNKLTPRPGSPQPLQRRSSGRGKSKLEPHSEHHHGHHHQLGANGHASPRSSSPSRSSSSGSSRRKPSTGTGSNPPSRNESPNFSDSRRQHDLPTNLLVKQTQNGKSAGRGSPAGSPSPGSSGESAFSKVRDTLKISKAKKKARKKKGAAYSVDPVEINFPASTKYQDPFEAPPSYTDSMEVSSSSKVQSHDFRPVSIPHNKPEYCDHCGETAWGLYRQVLKCSSELCACTQCARDRSEREEREGE